MNFFYNFNNMFYLFRHTISLFLKKNNFHFKIKITLHTCITINMS